MATDQLEVETRDNYRSVALTNTTAAVFMSALDGSIVIISLPAIFRGIHLDPLAPANITYLLWMIMGYRLVQSVLVVTLGRIGDMYGRVRVYNFGFTVFTVASILLSFDPFAGAAAAQWLIGWRLLQAVGGSMLTANSAAILTDAFPPDRGEHPAANSVEPDQDCERPVREIDRQPNTSAIMGSVRPSERGVVSGMRATFQNSGTALSIGVFFSLMVVGLAHTLPTAMTSGLQDRGVPHAVAAQVAMLPPVSTLFAAVLGVNPLEHLLAPSGVLMHLPPENAARITGREFFPNLISGPFHQGLTVVFGVSIALAVLAGIASLARGRVSES